MIAALSWEGMVFESPCYGTLRDLEMKTRQTVVYIVTHEGSGYSPGYYLFDRVSDVLGMGECLFVFPNPLSSSASQNIPLRAIRQFRIVSPAQMVQNLNLAEGYARTIGQKVEQLAGHLNLGKS